MHCSGKDGRIANRSRNPDPKTDIEPRSLPKRTRNAPAGSMSPELVMIARSPWVRKGRRACLYRAMQAFPSTLHCHTSPWQPFLPRPPHALALAYRVLRILLATLQNLYERRTSAIQQHQHCIRPLPIHLPEAFQTIPTGCLALDPTHR